MLSFLFSSITKLRVSCIATSSPRRIEASFDTGCFNSTASLFGRRTYEPAPQGPGLHLQEPSVNARILCTLMLFLVKFSTTFPDSTSGALVLFLEDPRLDQYFLASSWKVASTQCSSFQAECCSDSSL